MPLTTDGVNSHLRKFLARSLGNSELGDEDDIFEVGGATSLFAMELVMFIEETFRIAFDDEDLERANFRSISAISSLVKRKRNAIQIGVTAGKTPAGR